ncbi:tetratricopeptide repeat protein [Mangrovibacterium lignilyticum]|uniref:tetratricopeptide repeat protein n=1 Tax=Mangrovibacterium lignilyticum TaxID=2668052 RepID=UPI0013D4CB72|nr:tetratricopeptide repeat protein [Mangrovibacterium lignilyticum]
MAQQIEQISQLIDENRLDEASGLIDEGLQKNSKLAELYFLRGQIQMKKEAWGSAINCFRKALEIDPVFPGAQNRIEMAQSILGFFNPDLLNP